MTHASQAAAWVPPATSLGDSVAASWAEIVRLTSSLRQAAADEAWRAVVDMAVVRHRSLLAHFEQFPVGPDNAAFYHDKLTDMLRGEQELQAIAVEARKEVMRQSISTRHNHRAVGAYLGRK